MWRELEDLSPTTSDLYTWRIQRGLSQRQAAAHVYEHAHVWSAWETGKRRMHPILWESLQKTSIPLLPQYRRPAEAA